MKKYIYLGMGGFLGAISRYSIKNITIFHYNGSFPLNTFIINITGSLLLAILLTLAPLIRNFNENIRIGIGTGFFGAYTTFSTMCKETYNLFNNSGYIMAGAYILFSLLGSLVLVFIGINISIALVGYYRNRVPVEALGEIGASEAKEGEE